MFINSPVLDNNKSSKEEYLLSRAKEALSTDIYAAKSWLITAKSLFPHSAKIQVSFCFKSPSKNKNFNFFNKCFLFFFFCQLKKMELINFC